MVKQKLWHWHWKGRGNLLLLKFTTAIGILIQTTEKGLIRADEAIRYLEGLAVYGRYHRGILDDARQRLGG
jgi:hypothetical protein